MINRLSIFSRIRALVFVVIGLFCCVPAAQAMYTPVVWKNGVPIGFKLDITYKGTPLHNACLAVDVQAFNTLANGDQQLFWLMSHVLDNHGMLPLSCLFWGGFSQGAKRAQILKTFLTKFPRLIWQKDNYGNTASYYLDQRIESLQKSVDHGHFSSDMFKRNVESLLAAFSGPCSDIIRNTALKLEQEAAPQQQTKSIIAIELPSVDKAQKEIAELKAKLQGLEKMPVGQRSKDDKQKILNATFRLLQWERKLKVASAETVDASAQTESDSEDEGDEPVQNEKKEDKDSGNIGVESPVGSPSSVQEHLENQQSPIDKKKKKAKGRKKKKGDGNRHGDLPGSPPSTKKLKPKK